MRRTATVLCCMALLGGCSDDPAGTGESQDLATLRTLTAPYESFDAGKAAGYDAQFMGCFANDSGGMGIHFQDPAIDLKATPGVSKPRS